MQELRDTLAAEREAQIKILQQEQEQIRSQQAEEFKKRLEDDRRLLEQQTLEQIAKFEKELAHKMEEERANLEKVHNEQMQELTRKNELETQVTRTQLQAELIAHKHELQQAHLQVSGVATHCDSSSDLLCMNHIQIYLQNGPEISVQIYCYFLF